MINVNQEHSNAVLPVLKLEASIRQEDAKLNTAKKLRSEGLIPGIIYGKNKKNLSVFFDVNAVQKRAIEIDFFTQKIEINIKGEKHIVFPKAVDRDPVSDKIVHMDFLFGDNKEIVLNIPIIYHKIQDIVAVKQGGFFNVLARNIKISYSPGDNIPQIFLNLPSIKKFRILKIADIRKLFPELKILENDDKVIASIVSKSNILEEENENTEKSSEETK